MMAKCKSCNREVPLAPGALDYPGVFGDLAWDVYDLITVAHVQPYGLPCPTGGIHWCLGPEDDNVRHFILRTDDMWDLDSDTVM